MIGKLAVFFALLLVASISVTFFTSFRVPPFFFDGEKDAKEKEAGESDWVDENAPKKGTVQCFFTFHDYDAKQNQITFFGSATTMENDMKKSLCSKNAAFQYYQRFEIVKGCENDTIVEDYIDTAFYQYGLFNCTLDKQCKLFRPFVSVVDSDAEDKDVAKENNKNLFYGEIGLSLVLFMAFIVSCMFAMKRRGDDGENKRLLTN